MVSIIPYEAFHLKNPMLDDTMPMTKTINSLRYIQRTKLNQIVTKYKKIDFQIKDLNLKRTEF